jgi:hypothetical protein
VLPSLQYYSCHGQPNVSKQNKKHDRTQLIRVTQLQCFSLLALSQKYFFNNINLYISKKVEKKAKKSRFAKLAKEKERKNSFTYWQKFEHYQKNS